MNSLLLDLIFLKPGTLINDSGLKYSSSELTIAVLKEH